MRLQNDRSSAVLPDALQGELELAVGALFETVLRNRRARNVATEPVRTAIAGVSYAELLLIYIKLSGPLSVAYVDVRGKNIVSGQSIVERSRR